MYNQVTEKQPLSMIRDLGDTEVTMHIHTKGMHTDHKMSLYSFTVPAH